MDGVEVFPYIVQNPRLILHIIITINIIRRQQGSALIPFLIFIFYRFKLKEMLFI